MEESRPRILAVDDELPVLRIVQRLLESAGYNVEIAEGGQAAVDMCQQQPGRYECMILDLSMPDLSGEAVIREVRSHSPELPIVITSGFAAHDREEGGPSLSRTVYLQKPWRREQLLLAIEAAVGTEEAQSAASSP